MCDIELETSYKVGHVLCVQPAWPCRRAMSAPLAHSDAEGGASNAEGGTEAAAPDPGAPPGEEGRLPPLPSSLARRMGAAQRALFYRRKEKLPPWMRECPQPCSFMRSKPAPCMDV